MPSSPVHLKLAYLLADELGVENKPDFLLGAIAPDCVNYGMSQASEEMRYRAHIRERDYDKWKQKLRDFYRDEKPDFQQKPDFLRGYLFHCWCDIAWDEVVQPKLFEFLGTLGYGYDDMTKQKWLELYRFNSTIVSDDEHKVYYDMALKGEPCDIAGCPAELIGKFRDYVIKDYSDKITFEKPMFLGEEQIRATVGQMKEAGYLDELR